MCCIVHGVTVSGGGVNVADVEIWGKIPVYLPIYLVFNSLRSVVTSDTTYTDQAISRSSDVRGNLLMVIGS